MSPVFYRRPAGPGELLSVAPALASWDRAGSPGQVRSAEFVRDVQEIVGSRLHLVPDPLSIRLDVGLRDTTPLFTFHDLDNYLFPLIPRLSRTLGRQFVSVWATKHSGATSTIHVEHASPAGDPKGNYSFEVMTTASTVTAAYKQQIQDQVAAARPLRGDAIALQLAFVVGPRRTWPNLWKCTIDALGPILGWDPGAKKWNPRDGRITDLGLHCIVDPATGNDVRISVRATAL